MKKFFNIGITENMSDDLKITIRLLNNISIWGAIFWLFHAYVIYKEFNGLNYTYINYLISALLFVQILILNYFNKITTSKIFLTILLPLTLFTSSIISFLSIENYNSLFLFAPQATFITITPIIFLLFKDEKVNYIIFAIYFLLLIIYLPLLDNLSDFDLNIDLLAFEGLFATLFVINFILIQNLKKYFYKEHSSNIEKQEKIENLQNEISLLNEKLSEAKKHSENLEKEIALIKSYYQTNTEKETIKDKQIEEILEIARKTQDFLFAPKSIQKNFLKYYLVNFPKGEISGDFFSIQQISENHQYLIIGDTTGHGISSALISLLTINAIRDIIFELRIYEPAAIIEQLNFILQNSFQQTQKKQIRKVDIAIVKIVKSPDSYEIIYTGAKMPIYVFKFFENEVVRLKPDPFTIGTLSQLYKKMDFKEVKMKLNSKDMIFLLSDGLTNQTFQGKRYGTKSIINLIEKIGHLPLENQKKIVSIEIEKILQFDSQIDDILFVGVRLQ